MLSCSDTERTWSQEEDEEDDEEEKEKEKKEEKEKTAHIKSNNPHLTGGEQQFLGNRTLNVRICTFCCCMLRHEASSWCFVMELMTIGGKTVLLGQIQKTRMKQGPRWKMPLHNNAKNIIVQHSTKFTFRYL